MSTAATGNSFWASIERGVARWFEQDTNRAVVMLLAAFVAAWTLFQVIAYASIDLHPDLLEVFAWSRHPAPGYYKHPPLGALIAAAWFAVFPIADWSFHLLAMVNAAVGLFFVDRIARRYLSGDKRLLVLLLLLLTPFYQFHGQRFASNQTLLSTWPLATYCFLRAFESRAFGWSLAAGTAAALAMLGKYFSIYLILGIVVAALSHPARWRYLASASPWTSCIAGLIVLAPHLLWLFATGFQPFSYAYIAHSSPTLWPLIKSSFTYLAGGLGYVLLPLVAYALVVRPDRETLADTFAPADPDRRMLVILFAVPLLLPALTAPFLGIVLTSLWTMQAWFLLPILLLAPERAVAPRRRAAHAAIAVIALTIGALLAAPVLAWRHHVNGDREGRAYYELASEALASTWRQHSARPLRIVMGDIGSAPAPTFYLPSHPDAVPDFDLRTTPWVTSTRLIQEGFGVVCRVEDRHCIGAAQARTAAATNAFRREVTITPQFLGHDGKPERFLLIVVPPERVLAAAPQARQ